jgi:methylated-DNA-[protein]-cysteine S-methyltransferase
METFSGFLRTPIGVLEITTTSTSLVSVNFLIDKTFPVISSGSTEILNASIFQLEEYFSRKRQMFDLPIIAEGTYFQIKVWNKVSEVSFGKTKTYGELAKELGSLTLTRAVGTANGSNPIPIIIPCHRVIGSNGKLTGYSGGLWRKQWLLEHEASNKKLQFIF